MGVRETILRVVGQVTIMSVGALLEIDFLVLLGMILLLDWEILTKLTQVLGMTKCSVTMVTIDYLEAQETTLLPEAQETTLLPEAQEVISYQVMEGLIRYWEDRKTIL